MLPAGIVRITLAFLIDAGIAWTIWIALSGLVTILVGLVILARIRAASGLASMERGETVGAR